MLKQTLQVELMLMIKIRLGFTLLSSRPDDLGAACAQLPVLSVFIFVFPYTSPRAPQSFPQQDITLSVRV